MPVSLRKKNGWFKNRVKEYDQALIVAVLLFS